MRWIPHLTAMGVALSSWTVAGQAQDVPNPTLSDLQKQIQALQQEVERLKQGPPRDAEADDLMSKPLLGAKGLTLGFYGESKYRFPQSGANKFDAHRYVLTPSYQLTDWLVFNSELELEHGGMDDKTGAARSRFDGELEVEQMYVDILLHEHFNIRSLGIDLVPVGRINKYHEPTVFYSTERPELYTEIIPSTWMEPSMGFFGKIVEGLDYQLMISTGLEDAIPGVADAGVTGAGGVRGARPRMRAADENSLAYSGRLHYNGLTGLDASTSFYVTEVEGFGKQDSMLALWDIEALYRLPKTGLELRGDFAYWHIGDPENLLVNNNADPTDDVGNRMYGWYLETAYHFWPEAWRGGKGKEMDLVPFVRYSQIVTQSELKGAGTKLENGTTNKDFLTLGMSYFLNANFVVKADYRRNLDSSSATKKSPGNQDYFQVGVGMFF